MEGKEGRGIKEYEEKALKERDDCGLSTELRRDYESFIDEDEISLREYLDVIFRRKWIIITSLFLSVITVLIISLLMKPVYKAEATIEISPENPNITTFKEVLELDAPRAEYYETQYKLIKSRSLAKSVIKSLGLEKNPEFAPDMRQEKGISSLFGVIFDWFSSLKKLTDSKSAEDENYEKEEKLTDDFLERIEIDPDRKSRLVQVSFLSRDPELSAKAVNTLADEYIDWLIERKLDATKAARGFLEKQLKQVKAKLEKAEEELNEFSKNSSIVSLDEDLNLVYKQLAELNEALSESENERLAKEAFHQEIDNGNHEYLPQVVNDSSIQSLDEEYTKLKAEFDNLSVIYGPNYPDVRQMRAQLARIKGDIDERIKGIAESIKRDYQAALRKENIIRKRNEEQEHRATELNEKAIQYKILAREVDTNKSIYQNLLQRVKETEVTSGIKATNIQVVDYASVPLKPYSPNILLNLLISTLMGIMIGAILAFIFENFDRTIKDEEELKKRFSIPFLGGVPLADDNEINNIEKLVYTSPRSIISEAFRVVRTSVLFSSPDYPPKSILLTSTQPLEGKTTCASNLALSLTQSGYRVLLIDADMRRPRLQKIFEMNGKGFGLSSYLVGKIELPEVINRTDFDRVDVIHSGPLPPNPAELLGSNKMRELIQMLSEDYDHVIIDAPPVLGFADSRLLARIVDGVVIVTSIGLTQREAFKMSLEEIQKVNGRVIGVILNRLDSRSSRYGYNYHYYNAHEKSLKAETPGISAPNS